MKVQDDKVETLNRESCDSLGSRSLKGWMAVRETDRKGKVRRISNRVSIIENSNEEVHATVKFNLFKPLSCKQLRGKELGIITQESATYGGQSRTVNAPHFYIDFKNPCKKPKSAGKKRVKFNPNRKSSSTR